MPTMITILAATYVPLAFITVRTRFFWQFKDPQPVLTVSPVVPRHEYQSRFRAILAEQQIE